MFTHSMTDQQGQQQGRRARWSRFFMTINTNKRFNEFNEEAEELAVKYLTTADSLFRDPNSALPIIKFVEGSPSDILVSEYERQVEHGEINRTVHMHILFSLRHKAKLQLNYPMITKAFKDGLGVSDIHFFNRVFSDAKGTVLSYIEKTFDTLAKHNKKAGLGELGVNDEVVKGSNEKFSVSSPFEDGKSEVTPEVTTKQPLMKVPESQHVSLSTGPTTKDTPITPLVTSTSRPKKKEKVVIRKTIIPTLDTSARVKSIQAPPKRVYVERDDSDEDYGVSSDEEDDEDEEEVEEVIVPKKKVKEKKVKEVKTKRVVHTPKAVEKYYHPIFGWVNL